MGIFEYFYASENPSFKVDIKDLRLAYSKDKKRFASDVYTVESLASLESALGDIKEESNLVLELTVGDTRNYFKGEEKVTKVVKDLQNVLAVKVTTEKHLFDLEIFLPGVITPAIKTKCDIDTLTAVMGTLDDSYAFNIKPLKFLSDTGRYENLYGMEELSGCDKTSIVKMIHLTQA
jgi:hypothetical protein